MKVKGRSKIEQIKGETSEMKANETRWAYIEDPNGIWIEVF